MIAPESWPTLAEPRRSEHGSAARPVRGARRAGHVLRPRLGRRAASALVRRIADDGHELGSHSYWHRLVYSLTPDEFREDLRRAREVIERGRGCPVRGFRAPELLDRASARSGPSTSWRRKATTTTPASSRSATTSTASRTRPGSLHMIPLRPERICEWPGSTGRLGGGLRLPIGGGYFRLVPYAVTRLGDHQLQRRRTTPGDVLPASRGRSIPISRGCGRRSAAGCATTTIWGGPSGDCGGSSRTSSGARSRMRWPTPSARWPVRPAPMSPEPADGTQRR